MSLYFVAITPHAELRNEIKLIQKDFATRFNSFKSYRNFPHITLIPPFRHDEENESEVTGCFLKADVEMPSFYIQLNGFGSFPNKKHPVVFIKPENSEPLFSIFTEMDKKMSRFGYVSHFNPHLTVAYRDLTFENYEKAWIEYQRLSFQKEFQVNHIMLYKHYNGKWNEIARRKLN